MPGPRCLAPRHCKDRGLHVFLQQRLTQTQQHPPNQLQRKKGALLIVTLIYAVSAQPLHQVLPSSSWFVGPLLL